MIPDLYDAVWRKASRSGGTNGNCVELSCASATRAVRDSKNPAVGILVFGTAELDGFLDQVKAGRYDC
jgi:hypothetical protein